MPIEHLPATATPEAIAKALERDGCAVVDRLVDPSKFDRITEELEPFTEATRDGVDAFSGEHTKRTGALIARSPSARELITHPTVRGTVEQVLGHATNHQLHLTQIIAVGPGESAQLVHRDQWAFDFFPFPSGYEVQCNTLWAMDDFTEVNGATRVIPGSHRAEDRLEFTEKDTIPAEMEKGSVLLYTGSIYHGGGANRSDRVRRGVNLTYVVAWLRQEENQYLSCPQEIARDLDDDLLRLMGYARGAYALGYIDDLRDPLQAIRGSSAGEDRLGDLKQAARKLRSESR